MAISAPAVLRVLGTLADAGTSVAVAGGWPVDALVGRQTGEHVDLDLAIDEDRKGTRLNSSPPMDTGIPPLLR
jgi:lincosamide nucleotidyltransferase A/C/D/E